MIRLRIVDVLIVLILFLGGVVVYGHTVREPQDALCSTLIDLVQRSGKSIQAHPYYKAHPKQLEVALRENQQALDDLRAACP